MEYNVIVVLVIVVLILCYAGGHQKREYQRKEARLRNVVLEKMAEVEQLKKMLNTELKRSSKKAMESGMLIEC